MGSILLLSTPLYSGRQNHRRLLVLLPTACEKGQRISLTSSRGCFSLFLILQKHFKHICVPSLKYICICICNFVYIYYVIMHVSLLCNCTNIYHKKSKQN